MKKTILFRADGNANTGLGHLYRLFSLVEIVKDNFDFVFISKESTTKSVIPENYKKDTIPEHISSTEEAKWLSKSYKPSEYIIIADGYQFNSLYQKHLKDEGFALVYIDDLATEHMFADVVINHSPYLTHKDYKKEAYTKLALGTDYAMLRPSFLETAKQKRSINYVDSVFVCFGGADPFNLTYKAVTALLEINKIKKIVVVLGGAYKFQDIFELKQNHQSRVELHQNLSETELVEVMKSCNFAIVPASTILFEICCVKMPVLSGFYVDNQELIYKGFLNKNVIYKAGDMSRFKASDFRSTVEKVMLIQDYEQYVLEQEKLFDDMIKERHINLITALC